MWYFAWWIVGMILLTITIWINKHTVRKECNWRDWNKTETLPVKWPVWAYILVFLVACTPVLCLIAFFVGMTIYGASYTEDDIKLICDAKWYKLLIKLLMKKI